MKRWAWAMALATIPAWTGCSKTETSNNPSSDSANRTSVAGQSNAAPSNATTTPVVTLTPAAEIVAQFLDSVRRGDEEAVASLLTSDAIAELNKHEIVIDPPGSPEATFEIGKTEYTDEDQDAAYVELAWTEAQEASGEKKRNEALFVVRKEAIGWRIAGMVLDMGKDQPPEVIDFEDMSQHLAEEPSPLQSANGQAANGQPASGLPAPGITAPGITAPGITAPGNFTAPPLSPTAGGAATQIASPPPSNLRPIR